MERYIALLRGINVGGKNKILKSELEGLFIGMGFSNVKTYIQSGNIVFDTSLIISNSALESKIEAEIETKLNLEVPVIIRSAKEWQKIVEQNPFIPEMESEFVRFYVTFIKNLPQNENYEILNTLSFDPDKFVIHGSEIYLCYATKASDSKLTNNLMENKLKVMATTRNWKTVLKLLEMANP